MTINIVFIWNGYTYNNDIVSQNLYFFKKGTSEVSYSDMQWNAPTSGVQVTIMSTVLNNPKWYTINYSSTSHQVISSNYHYVINSTKFIPTLVDSYKSDLMNDFLYYYEGMGALGSNGNYNNILNSISNYLSNIDTSNSNINSQLSSILQILNTIAQKNPTDYTQQITGITNQMSTMIQSQQEVADNTTEMIQQQEEIKDGINDLNEFLSDDTTDTTTIIDNMPTNDNFQNVTESGFDNIFTTLRNAFTSENYHDVEFVVPFSNGQKITIPSNLTESIIPTAIKTLIQMVYWYFIARFIVKDIASYIEKAKSGDIFNSSDTNIKTDML